jgi:hypothetical protein
VVLRLTFQVGSLVAVSCGSAGPTDPTPEAGCLPGGTSETILGALAETGVAALCPGAVFLADTPTRLSDGQRIFTAGLPTDEPSKALIQVPPGATYDEPVIQDYVATNVEIRNIRIDGNRAVNPYTLSRALIAIAGNGSTLDGVTATNTSGVSAIAAADNPSCAGLRITNNVVADNGVHVGDATWANGIDIRCDDAYVGRNLVRDATDGGISFYGGRNTIIEDNIVTNVQRSAFSGILAADWIGGGDLTGSVVRRNTVETCCGQHVHVALSVGVHLWCYDPDPLGSNCELSSAWASGITRPRHVRLRNRGRGNVGRHRRGERRDHDAVAVSGVLRRRSKPLRRQPRTRLGEPGPRLCRPEAPLALPGSDRSVVAKLDRSAIKAGSCIRGRSRRRAAPRAGTAGTCRGPSRRESRRR